MAQPKANDKGAPTSGKEGEAKSQGHGREGWLRWVLGWVVAPGVVLGGIFGGGVFVGANHPDAGVVKAVLWVVGLF